MSKLPNFTSKAFFAPMAGVSDPALRLVCKELGAGLVVTEFTSIHAINAKEQEITRFIEFSEKERPLSVQLFGSDLIKLEKAIKSSPNYATGRIVFGSRVFTWEDVIAEVKNGTRFGRQYYQNFLEVLVNNLRSVRKRNKKEAPSDTHIYRLADARCKRKHRDYYDSLICVGPGSSRGFRPPCNECIEEIRKELRQRQRKTKK